MARRFFHSLKLLRGRIVGYGKDALAEDDLPRPAGLTPGTYTNATVTVSQNGLVVQAATGAGGGGGPWTQTVNESGASFANFTGVSGTWLSDGTVIKQTDTGATVRRAKYNTRIATGVLVFQADVQLKSAGADRRGGLIVGFDGSGTSGIAVYLNQSGNVGSDVDFVAGRTTVTTTVSVDTWYTLRVVVGGGVVTAYLDGVLLGSAGNNAQQSNDASFVGLYTFTAEVWFRNVKAWNLTLP